MAKMKRNDPELWEAVKAELTASKKGGKKGEWSARKAQLAVHEYKRRGGAYAAEDAVEAEVETPVEEVVEAVVEAAPAEDVVEQPAPEPTKKELIARAKELGVEGRSRLDKDGLIAAIEAAEELERRKEALTKRNLTDAAKVLGIEGRSGKTKDQLRNALADALGNGAVDECTKAELKVAAEALDAAVKSSMTKSAIASAARIMVM